MIKLITKVQIKKGVLTILPAFQTHFGFLPLLKASFQTVYFLHGYSRGYLVFFLFFVKVDWSAVKPKARLHEVPIATMFKVPQIPKQ